MDLLTERRDRLTVDQREMLNAIWGHYRETGHWITRKRLHWLYKDRQPNEVRAALTDLGGFVVYEASDDQKECYALLFLGILMTDQGPELEDLCVRYLDHVRKLYDQDPDVEQVNGKQIETDLGISPEQSKLLGALISFGRFYSRGMGGAGQPEWNATVPKDVDSLLLCPDLHRYVRTRASEGYEQNVPIEENNLRQWHQRKLGRIPSDLLNPLEVAGEHDVLGDVDTLEHDVFICHASEDKASFAAPLAQALRGRGLIIWYDEWSLTIGDSLRQSIDRGLGRCRYGIVVLSPQFFKKPWPQWELNGLVQKQMEGRKVILPIWHGVKPEDVRSYSPPLADLLAGDTADGIEALADKLAEIIRGGDIETSSD